LIRGRGIGYIREAPPPFDSPLKERGEQILERLHLPLTLLKRSFREGALPPLTYTPPFPYQGKGGRGIGY
jgi:hypothetical protein